MTMVSRSKASKTSKNNQLSSNPGSEEDVISRNTTNKSQTMTSTRSSGVGARGVIRSQKHGVISDSSSSNSILDTVIRHFMAHQNKVLEKEGEQSRTLGQRSFLLLSSSRNVEATQQSVVEARVQLLLRDLRAVRLSHSSKENDDSSGGQSCSSTETSDLDSKYLQELIDAITKCIDKAISILATQTTRDTNDASLAANSILELAASFGTYTLLYKSPNETDDWLLKTSEEGVADAIFQRAELATKSSNDMVRVAGCRLLGFCLKALGKLLLVIERNDSSNNSDEEKIIHLCNVSAKCLVSRCIDKSQKVRNVAIQVSRYAFLLKTQDAHEQQQQQRSLVHPEAYMFYSGDLEGSLANAMTNDSSHMNRAAAVSALPLNEESLLMVIDRVRDVNMKVRTEALTVLKDRVPSNALSEEQKVHILRSGFTGRCTTTQQATMSLLCCNWLKDARFQPYDLMELLDPTCNEDIVEKVAVALTNLVVGGGSSSMVFADLSNNEVQELRDNLERPLQKEITSLSLTPSLALYIRVRVASNLNTDNAVVSKVVPDMVSLSTSLQKHLGEYLKSVERMINVAAAQEESGDGDNDVGVDTSDLIEEEDMIQKDESFICSQILRLSELCQSTCGDEAGRRQMTSLICSILCSSNGDDNLVEPCVRTLASLSESEEAFFLKMTENLKEIEAKQPANDVNDSATNTDDEDDACEESRQLRWLSILSTMLEHTTVKRAATEDDRARMELLIPFLPYIEESLTNSSEFVRQAAVSCLTRYAIACGGTPSAEGDNDAQVPFRVLTDIANEVEETLEVRAQALLGLCDLHAVFSPSSVTDDPHPQEHGMEYLELLSQLMGCDNELKFIAAECCAKSFLLSSTMTTTTSLNEEVLARLVLNYFEIGAATATESEMANNVMDIGNPERLQQMLSLFFPAFGMRSHGHRISLVRSLKPLLELTTLKTSNHNKKKLPVLKMFDYIMSVIEMAHDEATTNTANEIVEDEEKKFETTNEETDSPSSEDKEEQQGLLLLEYLVIALLSMTDILLESRQHMTLTTMRSLCKKLGTKVVPLSELMPEEESEMTTTTTISSTTKELVEKLRHNVEELAKDIDDHYAEGPLEELEALLNQ